MTAENVIQQMKERHARLNKLGSYQRACFAAVERHGVVYPNQCNARNRKAYDRLVELGYLVLSQGEMRTDYIGYRLPHNKTTTGYRGL
jgi:hypothetical protein